MKKKYIYLIIIITVINLVALGTIMYQRWMNPGAPMQDARFERVKRELALSREQITHFEEIRHDFHTGIDSLNQSLESINRALVQEIWQPHPDGARIDTLLKRISQLQMESQQLVIGHFYQLREVLRPEQWQTLYGIMAEHFPGRMRNSGSRLPVVKEKERQ